MALGKPVVTSLDEAAVRETEEHFGLKVPIVRTTKDDLVDVPGPLVDSFAERASARPCAPTSKRCTTSSG